MNWWGQNGHFSLPKQYRGRRPMSSGVDRVRNHGNPEEKQLGGHIYSPQFQAQPTPANKFGATTLQCRVVVTVWAASVETVLHTGHHMQSVRFCLPRSDRCCNCRVEGFSAGNRIPYFDNVCMLFEEFHGFQCNSKDRVEDDCMDSS